MNPERSLRNMPSVRASIEISDRVKSLFGVDLKPKQIEAIRSLVVENRDTILVAGTGFGKSIVFHATPLLFSVARLALLIMPLKALEDEQAEKLRKIEGCLPFVLNGDNNTLKNLDRIRNEGFTHGRQPEYGRFYKLTWRSTH